jgi:DNA-binding SARP family transcriptional activator/DNA-binding XRE family transcriptional regulator
MRNSELVVGFGALVRAFRREAGLTQQELAAKAGLSVAALRDFEQCRRNRPRPSSVAALAAALGLDPNQTQGLARAAAPQWQAGFAQAADPVGTGQGLRVAALGPLEAWRDGTPVSLGPPARRAVLGLLVLNPGGMIRRDMIVDVLWGDSPPSTAAGLVQAHVSRLRRVLEQRKRSAGGDGVIDSVRGAYRLSIPDEELDLLVFRDLAERAAVARAGGDVTVACELYERAVGLWRGDPLGDVDVLSGHPGVSQLRRQLNDVLLRYADVASALGRYQQVLPRVQALAAAEPLNEPAHARLMIALAGSGEQAAAIRVYQDVRLRLDWELGLYPGEELTEAHMRVLRQDTPARDDSARASARRSAPTAIAPLVPRQLPAAPRYFTGRDGELEALSGLLERDQAEAGRGPAEAGGMVVAALTGMAGIGKTALAVHWAHQAAGKFPDGQLYVNLRGFGPTGQPAAPTEALCGFLSALGVPAGWIPGDAAGQAALFRSLLAGRRMLIVLDNALDAGQVRPLLPGSPGCLVLVTSRDRLTGLAAADGARLVSLGVLGGQQSRLLLARHLGAARAAAEPGAVSELTGLCARLPLALCDAAARAAARPALPLAALAARMRDERGRLDALETGEPATSVRVVFSWSRARLGEPAGRMFRLLGRYAGPDITVPAAASLAGLTRGQAALALAELCDGHLLAERAPGRYACHELLRAYAAEGTGTGAGTGAEAEHRAAVHRVLDHYLHTADAAAAVLYPGYTRLAGARPLPGVVPEEIVGRGRAAQWFESERHVLLAAIGQAADGGYAPHAWRLPHAAGLFFRGETYWRRLAAALASGLALARKLGDTAGQALASYHLGLLRFWLGEHASASHHLDEAIKLAGQLGDKRLRALVGLARARILISQDRILEALVQAGQSLRLCRVAEDLRGEIFTLNVIGWHLARLGEHQQAADYSDQALALNQESSAEFVTDEWSPCSILPNEHAVPPQGTRNSIPSNC